MNNNNLLDTKTVNSNDILGNGKKYIVPLYQRDYSWKEDNWEDLWADILLVLESNSVHYMGAIVLQSKGDDVYTIIDGQQRLTTITIIALACIDKIKELAQNDIDKEANEERVKLLSSKFIGDKDPSSLTYFSKLKLNENNNTFFQSYILTLKTPATLRNFKDSDKLLLKAYKFFQEKVSKYFEPNPKGEDIAKFLNETVAKRLMFIQIIVENELRAYTVFETLNSRGVGLTVTDLLKNYLFSLVSEVDLPHIRSQWNRIVDTVGLDNFPIFLRHYWISRNKLVRQEYLYKNIRTKVQNAEHLSYLLEELEKNAELYVALNNSADELWRGNKEIKKRIKELEIFQVKQCLPILLIAYDKIFNHFDKILKIITVISFRATVIGGYHSGRLEEVYNKAAIKIDNGEITSPQQLAEEVKELYLSDTDFKNDFSTISLNTRRNKKLIRYILFELENQISNNSYDFEEHNATIEHILPENPNEEWEAYFSKNVLENYVFRIGNYTLLEAGKNREIGNKVYSEKVKIFEDSGFEMTKRITFPEWNANNLDKRQSELAKIATSIWRVSYYE
ncbi:DUF262 domain-containing protein [Hugenholtzia roseola]|uniref:DUF262 domain-containing protein n=1 Tax=Hugenholtzia roseola TaxID=1002 RepID=UPI00047C553B|nr:DUF262 domain-containing protein [Hugenholtzia roseola]